MKIMKQPACAHLAISATFAFTIGFSSSANAQLSPNPNYGTINVSGPAYSSNFQNYGDILNNGSLATYDSFNNAATVSNNAGAQISNYGAFTNSGSGALNNYSGGQIRNFGTLTNSSNAATISYGQLTNSGTLFNAGTMHSFGNLANEGFGTLENHGTLTSTSLLTNDGRSLENFGTLNVSGELRNHTDAVNRGNLFNGASGSFSRLENLGRFDNRAYLFNDFAGTINSSGVLINSGLVHSFGAANNHGVFSNESTGRVESHGTFTNGSYGSTARLENSAVFINYGILRNETTVDNRYQLENLGTLENNGEVKNYGTLTNGGTLVNFGTLSNGPGAIGGALLVNQGTLDNRRNVLNGPGSTFLNEGLVKNGAYAASGVLENHGLLDNRGEIRNGGNSHISNLGTLKNYGLIINGDLGSSSTLENRGTLDNHGTLANMGTGPIINHGTLNNGPGLSGPARIENFGTLVNNGNLNNHSAIDSHGTLRNNGILTNYGTVNGSRGWYEQFSGRTINHGSMTQQTFAIAGGDVRGSGTFNGTVMLGAGVQVDAEGFYDSTGTLTVNGDLHSQANYLFELGGTGAGQFDLFQLNGHAFFSGGSFTFSFVDGYIGHAGDTWQFMRADSFSGWNTVAWTVTGLGNGLNYEYGFTDSYAFLKLNSANVAPVPEPETYAMLLAGLGLLGFVARRRKYNSGFPRRTPSHDE